MADSEGDLHLDTWQKDWDNADIGWHKDVVHKSLAKHVDQLTNGKEGCRIFVPLCGKSVDMVWLYERGHEVVGLEAIEIGVIAFFRDQNMKYTVSDVPGIPDAKLYQNEDSKIKIYKCDLFLINSSILGRFDAIWDRGSLVAINPSDRIRYAKLMCSLMDSGARMLLEVFVYDVTQTKWNDEPPFSVPQDDVKELYGSRAKLQVLDKDDDVLPPFRHAGCTWMFTIAILLTFN